MYTMIVIMLKIQSKKVWDKPIVQAGAAIAGYKAVQALGKRLGATTYTTDRKLRKF